MQQSYSNKINDEMDTPLPLWFMAIMPFYIAGFLALAAFPLARDWGWIEGWIMVITFSLTMSIGFLIINQKNPRVLRNRMKMKKEGLTALTRKPAGSDWWIMPVMSLGFFGALILPALAHRFGWAALPFTLEMAGVVIMNIGLVIMIIAMLQNSFAAKFLDIKQEQTLIDTGLYGRVRHPLYSGAILMILAIPIALGSLAALVPAAVGALSLVVRIRFEEDMLVKGMEGYPEYQKRVRYKLIPGVF